MHEDQNIFYETNIEGKMKAVVGKEKPYYRSISKLSLPCFGISEKKTVWMLMTKYSTAGKT